MRNYFKIDGRLPPKDLIFNDAKVRDTLEAWSKAVELATGDFSRISLYELPINPGPWDRVGIVGHRRRGAILNDMSSETGEDLEHRHQELARLDRAYFAAGRDRIPLSEVA